MSKTALGDSIFFSSVARGDIFSRACKACGEENPRVRFAAAECGHAMCSECAEGADTCPICDDPNPHFLRLFEDERGSRECGVCLFETPFVRSFFHCGHIVCLMCALNIACSADDENTSIQCPFCRESVNNVPTLVEERVKPDEAQAAFEDASNRKLQKKSKNKPTKIKRQKQKSCRVFNRVPLPRTS